MSSVRLPSLGKNLVKLLQDTTLRGFTGGLNTSDDDMNLNYRFATKLENCFPKVDGSIAVRRGTKLFARCLSYFSTEASIVNMEYFNASIIAVGSNGEILRIQADGTISRIFDTTIAATLSGSPAGWGETIFVSFAQFNGHLILCNGSDKPLDIDDDFFVEYLQDAATNTNINVPICKYVVAHNRYLVMGGDPLFPSRIHISSRDAAGTWFGDPPPNDGTRLDIGSVLPGATTIRGLLPFRGKLVAMFAEGLAFGTLGTYDENGNHTPNFDDGIEGFGSFSHRAGITYGDDVLFMDLVGVPSIARTVLSQSFKPKRLSELIQDDFKDALGSLSISTLEDRVFSVHHQRNGQFMLFIPDADTLEDTAQTIAFVYTRFGDNQNSQEGWSKFTGWNFTCGCRSLQGEMFFGDANGDIWHYEGDKDYVDLQSDPIDEGTAIEFDWELPWLDFGNRANTKTTRYISFDTRGASEFNVRMYVDNFLEWDGQDAPTLSTEFSAGEQGEFGSGPQPYGGGRNTSRKELYAWPAKFELAKLRFSGTASEGLSFVSITMHYHMGGANR